MPTRTDLGAKVQEGETFLYVVTIRDELGVVVDLTDASVTGTLDYYVKATGAAIAGRAAQSVIAVGVGANNHTVTAAGVMTWKSVAADALAVSVDTPVVARYTIVYNDGAAVARTGIHEMEFVIEDLPAVA